MASKLLTVPIDDLQISSVLLRAAQLDEEEYAELVESIKAVGVYTPLAVRENPRAGQTNAKGQLQRPYSILDGVQRYSAAKEAGLTELPVHVLDVEDQRVLEVQIEANAQRVTTKPAQYAALITKIMIANPLRTVEEQAGRLHKSPEWLKNHLGLMNLSETCLKAVDKGEVVISNAYALARLPQDEQDLWLDRAKNEPPGVFTADAKERAKEMALIAAGARVPEAGPAKRGRKWGDIEIEHQKYVALFEQETDPVQKKYLQGVADGLAWCYHQDAESYAAWKKDRDEREAKKAAKAAAKAEADGEVDEEPTEEEVASGTSHMTKEVKEILGRGKGKKKTASAKA